jgi:hypothetical protein
MSVEQEDGGNGAVRHRTPFPAFREHGQVNGAASRVPGESEMNEQGFTMGRVNWRNAETVLTSVFGAVGVLAMALAVARAFI